MDWNNPKDVTELAFRLFPYATELVKGGTIDEGNLQKLSKRLEELRVGLEPEMELTAVVNWLGKRLAVNRIDQKSLPLCHAFGRTRTPDVIAIVEHNQRQVPVLIEVKTSDDDKLVWSEDYLGSLKRYASAAKLPLLVAWKWKRFWLVDVAHFE